MPQSFYNTKRSRNPFYTKMIIVGTIAGSLFILAQIFVYLNNLHQNNYFAIGLLPKLLFLLSFTILLLANLTTYLLDKNNWPQVRGTVTNSYITRDVFSKTNSMLLQIEYSFTYKSKKYTKHSLTNLTFKSEEESRLFSKNFKKDKHKFINIYVFKFYPKLSSNIININIFYLLVYYLFIISFVFMFCYGFLFHLLDLGIAKIVTVTDNYGNSTNTTVQFQNSMIKLGLIFDISTVIILLLTLILLLFFVIKTIMFFKNNGFYHSIPRVYSNYIKSSSTNGPINEVACTACNYSNESTSLFCFSCGRNLWN